MAQVPSGDPEILEAVVRGLADEALATLLPISDPQATVAIREEQARRAEAAAFEIRLVEEEPSPLVQELLGEIAERFERVGLDPSGRLLSQVRPLPIQPDFQAALEQLRLDLEEGIAQSFRGASAFATELAEGNAMAIQNVAALLAEFRIDLASQLVTQQSETENRAQAQRQLDEASGEGGLFGFIGRAAGFISAPFDNLFSAIERWFLDEVRNGLNR